MKIFILLFTLISIPTIAKEWRLNWQHSRIGFNIGYMGLSTVDGTFNTYDGAFNYDKNTNELNKVEVVIQTKSIDTDNNKRDQHLKKGEFFNVTKFPQIIFTSTKTIYENDLPVKLEGLLTIKGIVRPVTLDMKIKGVVNDPWDKEKKSLFLEASTNIDRSDFGIIWNKDIDDGKLILSDKVNINLEIEAFEIGVRPAFSRFYLPTHEIKKSIKEEVIQHPSKTSTENKFIEKKKIVTSSIVKETNSTKGMIYTIVFGFIIFILMIGGAIKFQLWFSKFLEKLNFSDTLTFVIPNLIIIIVLTIIAIFSAPYMGYGTHPWQ